MPRRNEQNGQKGLEQFFGQPKKKLPPNPKPTKTIPKPIPKEEFPDEWKQYPPYIQKQLRLAQEFGMRLFKIADDLCPICDGFITYEDHVSTGGSRKMPIHVSRELQLDDDHQVLFDDKGNVIYGNRGFFIGERCPRPITVKLKKLIEMIK